MEDPGTGSLGVTPEDIQRMAIMFTSLMAGQRQPQAQQKVLIDSTSPSCSGRTRTG